MNQYLNEINTIDNEEELIKTSKVFGHLENEYNNYGRRGYDMKYRGYNHLDSMADHYGKYEDNRYGHGSNEETKRSLRYMLDSLENFVRMLKEDANNQEEIQMIRETTQRIAQM